MKNKKAHLIVTCIFLLTGTAFAGSSASFTLQNKSHYILIADDNTPTCATKPCPDVVGPGEQVTFNVPNNSGMQMEWKINPTSAPNQSNVFGFYVQNNNGTIEKPDTSGISREDMDTHSYKNNTLTLNPINPPVPITYPRTAPLRGLNLSGAEAGSGPDYMKNLGFWIPSYDNVRPYLLKGVNTVRYPIRYAYFNQADQPDQANAYLDAVFNEIQDLLKQHVSVILDLHNYMRTFPTGSPTDGDGSGSGHKMTTSVIQSAWKTLSNQFKTLAQQYNPDTPDSQHAKLIFEIMNEPNSMHTKTILDNTNAAIGAIRKAGIHNLILIEGNNWSGLWTWLIPEASEPANSSAFTQAAIDDNDNHWGIAMHQYFDDNGSGDNTTCISQQKAAQRMNIQKIVDYAKTNHIQIMLDEFGAPEKPTNLSTCQADIQWLLTSINQSPAFSGWTAWTVAPYTSTNAITPTQWSNYYQAYAAPIPTTNTLLYHAQGR